MVKESSSGVMVVSMRAAGNVESRPVSATISTSTAFAGRDTGSMAVAKTGLMRIAHNRNKFEMTTLIQVFC